MMFLYLDESGDLGFDFFNKRPSRFFTVTVLAVQGIMQQKAIASAIRKTLKRKLRAQKRQELKGSKDSLSVKIYFFNQIIDTDFRLFSLTLNKQRVYENLALKKERVYNFIAQQVLKRVPLQEANMRISLTLDRSKNKKEIKEFNRYLLGQLSGRIDPRIPLDINHLSSVENPMLQAVDLFTWGIYRKYEKKDLRWYNIFRDKIIYEEVYLL